MIFALLNPKHHYNAFRELVILLKRQRILTIELAKRDITDRYLGQVFGIFWTFGHPLIMILVYIFLFALVFKVKIGGTRELPLDYTTYLLAGLIPWLGFQESMNKAATVIVGNANLVKQVVFPVEILPVKGAVASIITQIIFLILLIGYVLITNRAFPWTYSLIPLLLLLQTMAMIGVAYILSGVGVYFRDVKDFVQVFSFVGLFLLPIFYLPSSVPEALRPILYVNPFSYMIWVYQDVLYFGRFEHWWAWPIFILSSIGLFVIGYRLFRKLKVMFGNML